MSVIIENPINPELAPPSTNADIGTLPRLDSEALERDTQERGRVLLQAVARQEKKGTPAEWFYNQLMGLSTRDEKLKVELFRFVDALPALQTPEAVSTHLREYLLRPDVKLPPGGAQALQLLTGLAPSRGPLSWASHTGAKMMARRFIAGANAHEATGAVERLRKQNMTFTLDLLGEAVTSERDALAYQAKYLELVRDLGRISRHWPANPQTDEAPWGFLPKVNVSVKLSSLYARFDPMAADATVEAVKERLRPILRLARETGAFVNFDMEQHDFCSVTQRIFEEVFVENEFRDWADVGIVAQAYLTRAEADLVALRDYAVQRGTPVWVRLVKGAYWDFETIVSAQRGHNVPVYQKKADTDACYERCTAFLIDNWQVLRPAFATHNVRSAAKAQALAQARGLPARAAEYQVLFGMGEPIGRALAEQGERVRVYVPFGELLPGMAYLVRRLLENSSNDSFIRKAGTRVRPDDLLRDPATPQKERRLKRNESNGIDDKLGPFINEPETDFALPTEQARMQQALTKVRGELGVHVPVVIGGQAETSGDMVARRDPSDSSRVVSQAHFATREQAERALQTAYKAFPAWRDTPVTERANLLRRVADTFESRRFEISAWMVYEVGKPWREADADVAEAIDFCRFYAREMEALASPEHPRRRDVPGEWNEYFYEGRGPAVIIAPWNFPLAILTGMAVAALVAGNTIVLKPAEQSSRVGYFLMEALQAAGCPSGVANFLPGDGEQIGPVLVGDKRTALVAFTGSRAVGLQIINQASAVKPGQREIKRVIAELGGKNALIIDEDADLDEAVLGVLHSSTGFAGQKCSACSRVIVVGTAYETFREKLTHAIQSIRIGPADDPATTLGPVVDEASRARVEKYVAIGNEEGRLVTQAFVPEVLAGKGNYVSASVFECSSQARLTQEEIFGPVVALLRAHTLDEALRLADDSEYALTGGFYSRSPRNIERIKREFRVGNLYINRKITGALVDRQPFGGARMSGVGSKAGGPEYLLQFVAGRTITESVMRRGFAPALEGGE